MKQSREGTHPDIPFDPQRTEQDLLARCRRIDLVSPPEISKNILYYTPCGRWIRICSLEYCEGYGNIDDTEAAMRISPRVAHQLLNEHGFPIPKELEDYSIKGISEEDREMLDDMDAGMDSLAPDRVRVIHTPDSISESSINHPEDSPEEYTLVVTIPRGALVLHLLIWSKEWDSPHLPVSEIHQNDHLKLEMHERTLTSCMKNILTILYQTNGRLKRDELISKIYKSTNIHQDGTIRAALPSMRSSGFIDNSQKEKPKGFGLTPLGRRLAERILLSNE